MRFLTIPIVILAPCAMVAVVEAQEKAVKWDFEDATVGKLPKGWTAGKTGEGEGSVWKIVEDKSAPKGPKVLAQTSESPGALFNLCVADETAFKDVELAVSFKSVKGKTDQGGGLVWRYLDANNYYVARINPLEDNFRLFKVVNGKRTQIATKDNLEVPAGAWHKMTVTMKGDQIECTLNDKKHLEAKDDTFTKAGRVGLWTKADAQSYFDDLSAAELK
jgi:hypothetical protein